MPRTIICVYQDCVMCGDRGKKLRNYIATHGLNIRKISFASEEGGRLVKEAVFGHKIGTMPFYTDGKIFTTKIEDFVNKRPKSAKNVKKTRKNIKEGNKNGDI